MSPALRKRLLAYVALIAAFNITAWHVWIGAATQGARDDRPAAPTANAQMAQEMPSADASFLQMYNAVEDAKLQHYLLSENHTIKAVILYLANTARVEALTKSLQLLHKHFNSRFRYPVVIFHEADFLPMAEAVRHTSFISEKQSLPIFFQQVNLSVPEWFLKKFGQPPEQSCTNRSVGYRSMCRFQAKLVYEQKVLRHFQYYWRLDDDSKITSRISDDVFEVIRRGRFSYGFVQSTIDDCAHNMFNVTADFIASRRIRPTFFGKLRRNEVFFNNFEVSSLQFWCSQQYRDYIEYIDTLGGIYLHRWGDAPIKTLALSMFVPLREIHRFRNIGYEHPINADLITNFGE